MTDDQKQFIQFVLFKKKLTEKEKDVLLSDMFADRRHDYDSLLMPFVLNDDLAGFKKQVAYMERKGQKIRELITSIGQ